MGIQTMSLQGGGGGGCGHGSRVQSLARQGSLYNLTLNEVQSQLGEPLNSMNLDELIKSVFPGDAKQSRGMDHGGTSSQCATAPDLPYQGSITMPQFLSKKTVDEVWRDIKQGNSRKTCEQSMLGQEEQMTLGEMTLEDFLVKAGVVAEDPAHNKNNRLGDVKPVGTGDPMTGAQDSAQGAQWLQQYHQMSSMDQQQNLMGPYMPGYPVQHAMGVGANPILDSMYSEGQLSLSSPTMGALSDPQTQGQKRAIPGDVADKTVERRQKRMIKNRESAARSRARKQAYTNELENKVSHLEEENKRLNKQKLYASKWRRRCSNMTLRYLGYSGAILSSLMKLEEILFVPSPEPKYQLRRTSSAPF